MGGCVSEWTPPDRRGPLRDIAAPGLPGPCRLTSSHFDPAMTVAIFLTVRR